MRILLAYAGKHGTTLGCVERLAQQLKGGNAVETVNLDEKTVDPSGYDVVVFGSSVYFGKMRSSAKQYLQTYANVLLQKPLGLFLVCGLTNEYEYYREKMFSPQLRAHAFMTLYFGGSLSVTGLPFFERMLVKSMRSAIFEENMENGDYSATLPSVLPENIDRMATYVRREIEKLADRTHG